MIKRCEELNLRVENEIEVAYHFLPDNIKIIGVTGSNGKTTTTTIIYNMLKCLGKSVVMGGNIGTPLTDLLPNIKSGDIFENRVYLSSNYNGYGLNDISGWKTKVYKVLPLTGM